MANSQFDLVVQNALVRDVVAPNYPPGMSLQPGMTQRAAYLLSQDLPPKAELVRLGQTWSCAIDTSDAFTYVAAWPTTRAELVLWNGEVVGGKTHVIDAVWMVDISSAAAAQSKVIVAQMSVPGIAAPTDNTSLLINSRNGKGGYPGLARKAIANTAFAIANKWEVIGGVNNVQAASIGASVYQEVNGGWEIPPQRALCLAGVASTAAGTAIIGVVWHEAQLALG